MFLPRDQLLYGKEFRLPRDKAFHGNVEPDGTTPSYRYGGGYYPTVNPWTRTIQKIRDLVERQYGRIFPLKIKCRSAKSL